MTEALQALARGTGKIVCWVGKPPSGSVSVPGDAKDLGDVARGWAARWGAAVLATPDALFFHTPGTFARVHPAHQDPLLPVYPVAKPLSSLPPAVLARFPLKGHDADLQGAVALTEIERASPGFEARLRRLMQDADARSRPLGRLTAPPPPGERLYTIPADQLYLRLHTESAVTLMPQGARTMDDMVDLEMPLSPSDAEPDPGLSRSVAALNPPSGSAARDGVRTHAGPLGELVRRGDLTRDDRPGVPAVVDRRLTSLPMTVCVPAGTDPARIWPALEAGIGVERRDLGSVLFFGPWLDGDSEDRFHFLSRAAAAHGRLWTSEFMPGAFSGTRLEAAALTPSRRRWILSQLARLPQDDAKIGKFSSESFFASGKVSLYSGGALQILYVAPRLLAGPPAVLGGYTFVLR